MEEINIQDCLARYNFVVPEIQREYVWGENPDVLERFICDIERKIADNKSINIGFLYSYKKGEEFYLIDGQQRYTTVLLLLYYLSTDNDTTFKQFVQLLKLDEAHPAFAYRVRSNTQIFLANLFKSGMKTKEEITESKWYRIEYQNDKTINSILGSLENFSKMELPGVTFDKILNNIRFWYFGVDKTSQGEELYITMNSRGERLSLSEHLKPKLFEKLNSTTDKIKYGKLWDEWEEFFYSPVIRGTREIHKVDIAMNNIIRIIVELKKQSIINELDPNDAIKYVSLGDIQIYIDALEYLKGLNCKSILTEIQRLYGDSDSDRYYYTLMAMLIEVIKHNSNANSDIKHEIMRVYNTIRNQVRRNKIGKPTLLLSFLKEYETAKDESFYSFVLKEGHLINGHELEKVRLCNDGTEETEVAIWAAQSAPLWHGNIRPLIEWATVNEKFKLSVFNQVYDGFKKFFNVDSRTDAGFTNNQVRRALLSIGLNKYPLKENSYTCFGYSRESWMQIFMANIQKIKDFILGLGTSDVESYCNLKKQEMDPTKAWHEFVVEDYLLDYLDTSHLCYNDRCGFLLVKSCWAKPISVKNMHLTHVLSETFKLSEVENSSGWQCWYWPEWNDSCSVVENTKNDIVLDIRYYKNNSDKYIVELHKRKGSADKIKSDFATIALETGFNFNEQVGRYILELPFDDVMVIKLVDKFIKN